MIEEKIKKDSMKIHQMEGGNCAGGCQMACGCGCTSYGINCHSRHFFLRWFLGLLIVVGVFCVGLNIGEWKGKYMSSYSGWHQKMYPMYGQMPVYIQETSVTDSSAEMDQ